MFLRQDASAYGRKAPRAYERMLAVVESGGIEAIATWHNDRLHRSPKELQPFIDLVERTRVNLAVVTGGTSTSRPPDGRLSTRIVGAVARKAQAGRLVDAQLAHGADASGSSNPQGSPVVVAVD